MTGGHTLRADLELAVGGPAEITRHRVDGPDQVLVGGLEAVVDDGDADAASTCYEPGLLGANIGSGRAPALAGVVEVPLFGVVRVVGACALIDVLQEHRFGENEAWIAL
jgi:hypothetical protein